MVAEGRAARALSRRAGVVVMRRARKRRVAPSFSSNSISRGPPSSWTFALHSLQSSSTPSTSGIPASRKRVPGFSQERLICIGLHLRAFEEGDDGVVKYSSAHIEGVESELVVRSSHSTQGRPETIEEVRRILLLHAGVK